MAIRICKANTPGTRTAILSKFTEITKQNRKNR